MLFNNWLELNFKYNKGIKRFRNDIEIMSRMLYWKFYIDCEGVNLK